MLKDILHKYWLRWIDVSEKFLLADVENIREDE